MVSTDNGDSWNKIIEYGGIQFKLELISNLTELKNDLYFLIVENNGKTATTMHIHS